MKKDVELAQQFGKIMSHLIANDQVPNKVEFKPTIEGMMVHFWRKDFNTTILDQLGLWYHKPGPQLNKSGLIFCPKKKKVSFLIATK